MPGGSAPAGGGLWRVVQLAALAHIYQRFGRARPVGLQPTDLIRGHPRETAQAFAGSRDRGREMRLGSHPVRTPLPPGEGRGLPASRNRPSEPSVSNHRPAPMAALTPNPSAPSASLARARVWASPRHRRLARRYGRIEFLIVGMALSPPVAPHPASRRRSYSRLQAGVGIPGEDSHLPDQLRLQAHDARPKAGQDDNRM